MKTILTITTFAFAMMVFAFNTNPVMAAAANDDDCDQYTGAVKGVCKSKRFLFGEADGPEQDSERDVADSGDEGATSAAQESDQ